MYLFVSVLLRKILQQPQLNLRVQEQRRMHHQQKEQNCLQGLQAEEVSPGRHVQKRVQIRKKIKLVQNPLPPPRTTAAATSTATGLWDGSIRAQQTSPKDPTSTSPSKFGFESPRGIPTVRTQRIRVAPHAQDEGGTHAFKSR